MVWPYPIKDLVEFFIGVSLLIWSVFFEDVLVNDSAE